MKGYRRQYLFFVIWHGLLWIFKFVLTLLLTVVAAEHVAVL